MLVYMSDKELKRLSVLQEICDQRITQSQAAQLLHISERQIYGFGPTLAHEKLTTVHGFDLSVETLRSWMIAADLWIPRCKRLKRP